MIGRFVEEGARLGAGEQALDFDPEIRKTVAILKELTWHYVINGPEIATQRRGQRRVIRELFDVFYESIHEGRWWMLPAGYQRTVEDAYDATTAADDDRTLAARLAADFVSALTEQQAVRLHRRVTGADMGQLIGPY
jgi:dGTPase